MFTGPLCAGLLSPPIVFGKSIDGYSLWLPTKGIQTLPITINESVHHSDTSMLLPKTILLVSGGSLGRNLFFLGGFFRGNNKGN